MDPMVAIRRAASEADLVALAGIVNAVTPDDPTTLEELRWMDATYPGGVRFLAEHDGRTVGAATVGRIFVYPPDHPDLWASIVVDAAERRRGIGSAFLRALSDEGRRWDKRGLQFRTWDSRPEGIDFLRHRGFAELERARMVRLELAGLAAPAGTRRWRPGSRPSSERATWTAPASPTTVSCSPSTRSVTKSSATPA